MREKECKGYGGEERGNGRERTGSKEWGESRWVERREKEEE